MLFHTHPRERAACTLLFPALPLSQQPHPSLGKAEGLSGQVTSCHTQFSQLHFKSTSMKLPLVYASFCFLPMK